MKRYAVFILFFLAFFAQSGAPVPVEGLTGPWEGAIAIMGQELKIIVHFSELAGALKATIDIPQQMATGLPLSQVKREGDKIHFELVAGPGVAVFDGSIAADAIQGDFLQAGIKGTFRVAPQSAKPESEAKEGEKSEPLPYKAEEIALTNGKVQLAGTLTIPEGQGPFPAVIMITGSGTQNRDEDIFGFKIFRVIADHLTRKGIAVLRCDDRGLGAQGAYGLDTSADFASDVVAQGAFLRRRPEIDPARVGLFGHSEGGLIAPLANREGNFSFLVLMAGTAVKGSDVLLEQIALIARANGASEAEIAQAVSEQKRVYTLMGTPEGEKEIARLLADQARQGLDKLPPEQRQAIADPEAYVQNVAKAQTLAFNSPWFRYFLAYDPRPALMALKCPVLALFGEKDMQVAAKQNLPVMAQAFKKGGNHNATIRVLPGANHLFQQAKTGSPSEYAALEKAFVPGFLDTISSWILSIAGPGVRPSLHDR
jgi:pimeloyl-ACP methyl ester carboxylesterase